MVKRTIHIIVTCTERKRMPVPKQLRLRSVRYVEIEKRAEIWCDRLQRDKSTAILAEDLYLGEHWKMVLELPKLAQQAGFDTKLWILSAGYGLIPSTAKIHSYSATFASSQPDSIIIGQNQHVSKREVLQNWWNRLSGWNPGVSTPRTLSGIMKIHRDDNFLLLASPDYLLAIQRDLLFGMSALRKFGNFGIISSKDHALPDELIQNLIISDARLQSRVGGTRTSLHARVAAIILKEVEKSGFELEYFRRYVGKLVNSSPELKGYERRRMCDDEVRDFITRNLERDPNVSCTALLRRFRDSDQACEQSRFKDLYWKAKESRP